MAEYNFAHQAVEAFIAELRPLAPFYRGAVVSVFGRRHWPKAAEAVDPQAGRQARNQEATARDPTAVSFGGSHETVAQGGTGVCSGIQRSARSEHFQSVQAMVIESGLDGDVVPHILRHTGVTWGMQNGMDIWDASGYFGMTVQVLTDVYGHHHPDHLRDAAARMGRRR